MANDKRITLQHLRSNNVETITENGVEKTRPVAPLPSQLEEGEIAINMADGHETLYIKNKPTDNSEAKVIAFLNENVIYENERVTAEALTELREDTDTLTDALDSTNSRVELLDGQVVKSVSMNNNRPMTPVRNNINLGTVLTDIELEIDNSTFILTVKDASNNVLDTVDLSTLAKSGLIRDARLEEINGEPNLVLEFDNVIGQDPVTGENIYQTLNIPLTALFNADNYYTKTDADKKFNTKTLYIYINDYAYGEIYDTSDTVNFPINNTLFTKVATAIESGERNVEYVLRDGTLLPGIKDQRFYVKHMVFGHGEFEEVDKIECFGITRIGNVVSILYLEHNADHPLNVLFNDNGINPGDSDFYNEINLITESRLGNKGETDGAKIVGFDATGTTNLTNATNVDNALRALDTAIAQSQGQVVSVKTVDGQSIEGSGNINTKYVDQVWLREDTNKILPVLLGDVNIARESDIMPIEEEEITNEIRSGKSTNYEHALSYSPQANVLDTENLNVRNWLSIGEAYNSTGGTSVMRNQLPRVDIDKDSIEFKESHIERPNQHSPGVITYETIGSLTPTQYSGNAASATKATQDGEGNVITETYLTKATYVTLIDNFTPHLNPVNGNSIENGSRGGDISPEIGGEVNTEPSESDLEITMYSIDSTFEDITNLINDGEIVIIKDENDNLYTVERVEEDKVIFVCVDASNNKIKNVTVTSTDEVSLRTITYADNNVVSGKADASSVYTKTEVDDMLETNIKYYDATWTVDFGDEGTCSQEQYNELMNAINPSDGKPVLIYCRYYYGSQNRFRTVPLNVYRERDSGYIVVQHFIKEKARRTKIYVDLMTGSTNHLMVKDNIDLSGLVSVEPDSRNLVFTNTFGVNTTIDMSQFFNGVEDVQINNGDLVIKFANVAQGGNDTVRIPLSQIFNADNYYTKTETDENFVKGLVVILDDNYNITNGVTFNQVRSALTNNKLVIYIMTGTDETHYYIADYYDIVGNYVSACYLKANSTNGIYIYRITHNSDNTITNSNGSAVSAIYLQRATSLVNQGARGIGYYSTNNTVLTGVDTVSATLDKIDTELVSLRGGHFAVAIHPTTRYIDLYDDSTGEITLNSPISMTDKVNLVNKLWDAVKNDANVTLRYYLQYASNPNIYKIFRLIKVMLYDGAKVLYFKGSNNEESPSQVKEDNIIIEVRLENGSVNLSITDGWNQ